MWKKDQKYQRNNYRRMTSGNEQHRVLFPVSIKGKKSNSLKKVVLPISSTTLDEHRYNESHEVLFP